MDIILAMPSSDYSDYYCESGRVTPEINFHSINSLINILKYFFRRNTYEIMVLYHQLPSCITIFPPCITHKATYESPYYITLQPYSDPYVSPYCDL